MFESAALKLSIMYLAIIMTISLFFSLHVYNLSSRELSNGVIRQRLLIGRRPSLQGLLSDPDFLNNQNAQIEEGKRRIMNQLVLINFVIIAMGGAGSYALAKRTLRPIHEAHEAQSRFTADASHELRTPLTAMQTEIEVALRNPKLTLLQSKEQLQSNLEELAKLKKLAANLLALARQADTILIVEETAISKLIEAARKHVENAANKKNIVIEASSRQVQAFTDPARLEQVLVILLDNAVRYSLEDTKVQITTTTKGEELIIEVEDQGIGIAKADLEHIFDRFYRVENSRSKLGKQDGYGLGLAIAKQLVELQKGHIEASSSLGKGSTFTIHIPKSIHPQGHH